MKQRLAQLLEDADEPLSTNAIADRVDADWHTVKDALDDLVKDGRAHRSRVSPRLTLYWDRPLPF